MGIQQKQWVYSIKSVDWEKKKTHVFVSISKKIYFISHFKLKCVTFTFFLYKKKSAFKKVIILRRNEKFLLTQHSINLDH